MTTFSETSKKISDVVTVVGGGLAGAECAWTLAERGHKVHLIEMRGSSSGATTPAHKTADLAELVCSNSLGSQMDYSAPAQLKWEAAKLGSLILRSAKEAAIPAGMALGVDRVLFARAITQAISSHPNIQIERRQISNLDEIPRPAVIATGPLTPESLALSIRDHLKSVEDDEDFLYFFDAIAPIIDVDTINMKVAWYGNRFNKKASAETLPITSEEVGFIEANQVDSIAKDSTTQETSGDYINCPLEKEQYFHFINAIKNARKIEPKEFEKNTPYFEGCMPIEAMVERGDLTPRFGPMSSNGLVNPHTSRRPFAVVQLRQENREATAYNMVGFQTKMAYGDQKEVFRLIPGLEDAEFLKLGSIHRNMYIHTPRKLAPDLSSKNDPWLFFAGQITGVEGYFDSTCVGLMVGLFLSQKIRGGADIRPPRASAMGSLLNAITDSRDFYNDVRDFQQSEEVHKNFEKKKRSDFQPTNINFGLFPIIPGMDVRGHADRLKKRELQLTRAKSDFSTWIQRLNPT